MSRQRTFGWIQNPNLLSNLKKVVSVFDENSSFNQKTLIERLKLIKTNKLITDDDYNNFINAINNCNSGIDYSLLKGKGPGGAPRSNAKCSGIIQASLNGEQNKNLINTLGNTITIKKPYVDDWTADGYIRWAVSTGLLDYDSENDTCIITELGKQLSTSQDGSDEEKEAFTLALLSYPPVCRVLQLLLDGKARTKFEIGANFGFKGEPGFTSIPQNIYVYDLVKAVSPTKKAEVRANEEGDSDKYVRTIANWLVQMHWLKKENKVVTEKAYGETVESVLPAWVITRDGEKAYKRSIGNSSNPKISKIVMYEMLATKISGCDYVRKRRGLIIESLKYSKNIDQILDYLRKKGLNESNVTISDDINNLENIGLTVSENKGIYSLKDNVIKLKIPNETFSKTNVIDIKDRLRSKLFNINHDYLDLVDLAYSGNLNNTEATEFEIQTANLFVKELGFSGMRLGGSNKPDVIISHDKFGTIIDNKAYSNGFNIDGHCRDEMARYIEQNQKRTPGVPSNEWWKNFDSNVCDFSFLFITSYLTGQYEDALKYISHMRNIDGGALEIEDLLLLAEKIKSNEISKNEFFDLFENKKIVV